MVKIPLTNSDKFAIADDGWEEDLLENGQTWALSSKGYVYANCVSDFPEFKHVYLHRLILGDKAGYEVDHINRNKLDNRAENLRHVTRSQQAHNRGLLRNNTSGHSGVGFYHNRWRASIAADGEYRELGRFKSREEAIACRQKAEQEYWAKSGGAVGGFIRSW